MDTSHPSSTDAGEPAGSRRKLLARHPWLPFVLPLAVYMVMQGLEPSPPELPQEVENSDAVSPEAKQKMRRDSGSRQLFGLVVRYDEHYPIVYTAKVALTAIVLALVWPAYRQFPFRVSWLALAVGVLGVVVWIAFCQAGLEARIFGPLGLGGLLGLGERPGYNPLEHLHGTPVWAYVFLAIRFAGLVLVVPIIEEMFYRALLMRLVMAERWWEVPFGEVNRTAVVVGILVPALAHPSELFAAVAWFGLVTWLMVHTRNIWDCVAAHAATNLLLGIYVVWFGQWQLW